MSEWRSSMTSSDSSQSSLDATRWSECELEISTEACEDMAPLIEGEAVALKRGVRDRSSFTDHRVMEEVTRSTRRNGRFVNPWSTWSEGNLSIYRMLKWQLTTKHLSAIPNNQELERTLPVLPLQNDLIKHPPPNGIRVTWMGHATLLVQMENLTFLTDPIFTERCSPSQLVGPKRYRPSPCTVDNIPRLDAVLISHTHYDHLDTTTVRLLNERFGTDLRWFLPLGLLPWFEAQGCENVLELDWWEENCVVDNADVHFVFTPTQHWSGRGLFDRNAVLWGSWTVIGQRSRFFFCGDSAYCPAFNEIGRRYGPFDVAALPIASYYPRWFMKNQHMDPAEAVQVHRELKAGQSIGIHWGTFPMSNEFYLEPLQKLEESLDEAGLSSSEFITLKHGETKLFNTMDNEQ